MSPYTVNVFRKVYTRVKFAGCHRDLTRMRIGIVDYSWEKPLIGCLVEISVPSSWAIAEAKLIIGYGSLVFRVSRILPKVFVNAVFAIDEISFCVSEIRSIFKVHDEASILRWLEERSYVKIQFERTRQFLKLISCLSIARASVIEKKKFLFEEPNLYPTTCGKMFAGLLMYSSTFALPITYSTYYSDGWITSSMCTHMGLILDNTKYKLFAPSSSVIYLFNFIFHQFFPFVRLFIRL